MTDRNTWNMARIASARPLPKPRKVHAEVCPENFRLVRREGDSACKHCGYHVCGCKPVRELICADCARTFRCTSEAFEKHDCASKPRPWAKDGWAEGPEMATPSVPPKNLCCDVVGEHSTGCRFHPANPITKDKTWGKTRGTVATATAAAQAIGPAPAGLYSKRALECVAPKSVNRDRIGCDECGGLRIHAIGCKREPAQYNGY